MTAIGDQFLRAQLEERRKRLLAARDASSATHLTRLLRQVDSALERMDSGTYGLCEQCHDPIEADRLFADPLACLCLDHLTVEEQRALESDLELAAQVQRTLLPANGMRAAGWHFHYHWRPMALVSGDYCDLIHSKNGVEEVWFLLGDVSGKGVAASMLMTHLHAIFRSLTSMIAPLDDLKERDKSPDIPIHGTARLPLEHVMRMANSVFSRNVMAGLFATLVAGRANSLGEVEIFNAGHCPVLAVKRDEIAEFPSTGLPLGMFSEGPASVQKIRLDRDESLFLYTDGLSEALNPAGDQYGEERLAGFLAKSRALSPDALVTACLRDLEEFASGTPLADDLTVMVIQQTAR